jgi:cystathionine gamma-synthase
MTDEQFQRQTRTVRAAVDEDHQHGAVMPPVYLSSTFTFAGLGESRPYDYTRSGNPTRDQLGAALAAMEGGVGAIVTASGMAAIALALELLPTGARLVAPADCYGGTFRLLTRLTEKGRLDVCFVDQSDHEAVARALVNAGMLWIESPTNPLLRVMDIQLLCGLARSNGALSVVDNTFLSPALQQPLALGADLVVHSTTKYLNGHSDVVGGAVVAARETQLLALADWANTLGVAGSPFDSFLTLRGMRTLHARLRIHEENAQAVARALADHPAVTRVFYPGLPDHPQHELARRQQSGFGGMLSFELAGGEPALRGFLEALQLFSLAVSLGSVESLVCHPATMSHVPLGEAGRRAAGISDNLVRLSLGIEAPADLVADLKQALDRATDAGQSPPGGRARD